MSENFTPYALVADDEALIRMDAAEILQDAGFRTYEACNVDEAVAILEKSAESIQLLFTDVEMPGDRDGFDLAQLCASRWPNVSILVASGRVSPEQGDLPDGAVFVGKPFSTEVVIDRLQELLPDGAKPEPLKLSAP